MIEGRVAELAKVEKIPLRQYLSEAEFALMMQMSAQAVRWFVYKSKIVHGILYEDGRFLIHRLSAYRAVQKHMANVIRRQTGLKMKKEALAQLGNLRLQ